MIKIIDKYGKLSDQIGDKIKSIVAGDSATDDWGKILRIYSGFDPTGKLHLGHSVLLKKLRQFQDLGHEIIVLIGDFTAQIGDPTDKLAVRKKLTKEEIKVNTKDYKKLIGKILDTKKSNLRFLHNEHWTNKLNPSDMLEIASYFTVSQLLERDMFQNRLKDNQPIRLHELLYPVSQAIDSVKMIQGGVDLEIGVLAWPLKLEDRIV